MLAGHRCWQGGDRGAELPAAREEEATSRWANLGRFARLCSDYVFSIHDEYIYIYIYIFTCTHAVKVCICDV